ncbi:MAG TPA: hypothetical protein VIU87_10795 [Mycobacterium sp.]
MGLSTSATCGDKATPIFKRSFAERTDDEKALARNHIEAGDANLHLPLSCSVTEVTNGVVDPVSLLAGHLADGSGCVGFA